ncbi:peptide chain release factor N(5)-glutamine methyltransferase [Glaciecola sp. 1036]|uniref:peptide chain release factor N(5)-glutamine methyltransferase n=1 Tax=Alteromonadaceae TaxID=72275 RepID=UPI003D025646
MLSNQQAIEWGVKRLEEAGFPLDDARFEAKLLLKHVTQLSSTDLITKVYSRLDENDRLHYESCILQRVDGKPVAYITGETGFWNLSLYTDTSTLIPRPDTETLVEWALELPLPATARVIDLGTGTGAIALSLKSERPQWDVSGIDKIAEAVSLAKKNAQHNQLNVAFFQSHWFDSVNQEKFDLIVSNPPYVESDSAYLEQGDLRFEPMSALVSANNGYADLTLIIEKSRDFLSKDGWLLLEHGFEQAEELQRIFNSLGFTSIQTKLDLNGLPRITGGQFTQ